MFRVTVTPEVARLRDGDTGSRNVYIGDKDPLNLYTFTRRPVFFASLPAEVDGDEGLLVTEVGEAAMLAEGGHLTLLPGEEPDAPAESTTEAAPIEPAAQEEPAVQDVVVTTNPQLDPKLNKSNTKPAPKPRGKKGRR